MKAETALQLLNYEQSRLPVIYDQYFIDELKTRADILRIIERYVPLKKRGANWTACCPFHQEKTPSFSVNPAKGFFKCFGCGKGGNVFTFLMEIEGLSFPEAVRRVAEISGIPLPVAENISAAEAAKKQREREAQKRLAEQIVELNRVAAGFWHKSLFSGNRQARKALEYLNSRGINEEACREFQLGFAQDSWDTLLNYLRKTGASEELILLSGLVSQNDEKTKVFDRFRNRIIFPVSDEKGNVIAFGARAMGDDQPKYLNSPETAAYIKGRHLYGLNFAKDAIRKSKFAILVEGYLDLIALHINGIKNVVAGLGTALTVDQAALIAKFTRRVVINYDGDEAGIKAAMRAITELNARDIDIKVLTLPNGQDPDEFIRVNGVSAYNKARGQALPFLTFALETAMRKRSMANPRDRSDAIEEILPIIASVQNPIQKRQSFDDAMAYFGIDDAALKRELWQTVKSANNLNADSIAGQARRAARPKITVAEQYLLELLIHDAELRERILPVIEPSDYEHLASARIFDALFKLEEMGAEPEIGILYDLVGDDEIARDFVPLLLIGEPKREPGEVIDHVLHEAENCLFSLRSMAIEHRLHEISRALIAAEQLGDKEAVTHLVTEQLDLSKIKQNMLTKLRQA